MQIGEYSSVWHMRKNMEIIALIGPKFGNFSRDAKHLLILIVALSTGNVYHCLSMFTNVDVTVT